MKDIREMTPKEIETTLRDWFAKIPTNELLGSLDRVGFFRAFSMEEINWSIILQNSVASVLQETYFKSITAIEVESTHANIPAELGIAA